MHVKWLGFDNKGESKVWSSFLTLKVNGNVQRKVTLRILNEQLEFEFVVQLDYCSKELISLCKFM